jgi:hypothetical protein
MNRYVALDDNALFGYNNGTISRVVPSVLSTGTAVIGLYDSNSLGFEFIANAAGTGTFQYRYDLNSTVTLATIDNGTAVSNQGRILSNYIGLTEPNALGTGIDLFVTSPVGEGNIAINTGTGLTKLFQSVDPITKDASIRFYHGDAIPLASGTYIDYSTVKTDSIIASSLSLINELTVSSIHVLSTLKIDTPDGLYTGTMSLGYSGGKPLLLMDNAPLLTGNAVLIQGVRF